MLEYMQLLAFLQGEEADCVISNGCCNNVTHGLLVVQPQETQVWELLLKLSLYVDSVLDQ